MPEKCSFFYNIVSEQILAILIFLVLDYFLVNHNAVLIIIIIHMKKLHSNACVQKNITQNYSTGSYVVSDLLHTKALLLLKHQNISMIFMLERNDKNKS